ncbi:hypothetical protein Avbf_15961, partial [Armadillidium vulgare]
ITTHIVTAQINRMVILDKDVIPRFRSYRPSQQRFADNLAQNLHHKKDHSDGSHLVELDFELGPEVPFYPRPNFKPFIIEKIQGRIRTEWQLGSHTENNS